MAQRELEVIQAFAGVSRERGEGATQSVGANVKPRAACDAADALGDEVAIQRPALGVEK